MNWLALGLAMGAAGWTARTSAVWSRVAAAFALYGVGFALSSPPFWSWAAWIHLALIGLLVLVGARLMPGAGAALLTAALVGYFSGGPGGPGWMTEFVARIFSIDEATAQTVVVGVRKGVHYAFYGAVAWSVASLADRLSVSGWHRVGCALLWTLGLAAADELRQFGTPGRTGSALDVALDMAGAATALLIRERRARSDP